MISYDVGVVLRLLKVGDTKGVAEMPENEVIFYLLNRSFISFDIFKRGNIFVHS